MEKLWRYEPQGGFTNKNAGFSMWCFGTYQGREYFIKQFLSPKFPANDTESSQAKIAKKIAECQTFEARRRKLYAALAELSDGNDVRILEFFRVASRYYIVTEKVEALPWAVEDVAALDEAEKRRLCAIIAHAIAALHSGGMVHSDIKHDNILYTYTESGKVTAKIIDFDGGFFEDNPPAPEEDITGDENYFSPEACARSYDEDRPLTCKLDVFALGILFHQYFSGEMPGYDHEAASCPGEAVLQGNALEISPNVPEDVAALLRRMLAENPDERPAAQEVFLALRPKRAKVKYCTRCGRPISGSGSVCAACAEEIMRASAPEEVPAGKTDSPFYTPGDL